jgi:hypothetical protein
MNEKDDDRGNAHESAQDPIELLAIGLPRLDVEPARAEAIRARAHAELARGSLQTRRAALRRHVRRAYRRVELPMASAVAVLYLTWALQTVLAVSH